jgi:hypothetical protein
MDLVPSTTLVVFVVELALSLDVRILLLVTTMLLLIATMALARSMMHVAYVEVLEQ